MEKRFLRTLYIGSESKWELSRSKFQEKAQPLDLRLTVRFGEQGTAQNNQWLFEGFETSWAIMGVRKIALSHVQTKESIGVTSQK